MKKLILGILILIVLTACSANIDEAKALTVTYLDLYKFDSNEITINQETLVNNFLEASNGLYTYDEALIILDGIYGQYDYEIISQERVNDSYISEIKFKNVDFDKIFDEMYQTDSVKIAEVIASKDQNRFDAYSNNLYINTFEELKTLTAQDSSRQEATTSFKVDLNDDGVWQVSNEEVLAYEAAINFDFNTTLKNYYNKIQEFINSQ